MKILAFTDMHGDLRALARIKLTAIKEKPDLIICTGDISIFGAQLNMMLSQINKTGIQTIIIPGNHETEHEIREEIKGFEHIKEVHKREFRKDNYLIIGYGEGGFAIKDPEFDKFAKEIKKRIQPADKVILLTHQPPYGTKVDKIGTYYTGNKSITKFIKETQPILAISGHIHENEGKKDKIGKTLILNPGYKGMIIEV
jgi:hypothetical protein